MILPPQADRYSCPSGGVSFSSPAVDKRPKVTLAGEISAALYSMTAFSSFLYGRKLSRSIVQALPLAAIRQYVPPSSFSMRSSPSGAFVSTTILPVTYVPFSASSQVSPLSALLRTIGFPALSLPVIPNRYTPSGVSSLPGARSSCSKTEPGSPSPLSTTSVRHSSLEALSQAGHTCSQHCPSGTAA